MEKTTIFIATHKAFIPPLNPIYKPIVAGAYNKKLPYLKDNTKENISDKNPYYSELTALYWIWKNDNSPYIGFTHYHRFFYEESYISKKEIHKILKEYQMIVPVPLQLETTILEQYATVHYKKDLLLACQEVLKHHFDYKEAIEMTLNQNKLYAFNMFISSREIINEYLFFLFPILFELEKQIPYFSYSIYNQRVFGFLAERIFNIYLRKNKIKVWEYPIKEKLSEENQILKRKKIINLIEKDKKNARFY